MNIIKYGLFIALFIYGLFFVVSNNSTITTKYQCIGKFDNNDDINQTVFLKLDKYRWWVHLWATKGADGNLYVEIPSTNSFYDYNVTHSDNYYWFNYNESTTGSLSTLSNAILIRLNKEFYAGTCKVLAIP
jgi:hypothetical protein